ncbi:IS3 family transposase [Streptomyces sp. NPDC001732]
MRDAELKELISQVHTANYRVYGARKIWRELNRQGHTAARCTIERLMRELGIQGAVRGKRVRPTGLRTVSTAPSSPRPRTGGPPRKPGTDLAELRGVCQYLHSLSAPDQSDGNGQTTESLLRPRSHYVDSRPARDVPAPTAPTLYICSNHQKCYTCRVEWS